jgi:hypothetical protein
VDDFAHFDDVGLVLAVKLMGEKPQLPFAEEVIFDLGA